ncbi:5-azacytidine-induced protein 2 isoform X1 [Hemiscyllium ocellatum]|uniref:5-azacytidine-induced protein 2 isoform X1 n=2 Tax=Hemiscyllium ocellatum TaxID=170820 RepID=UPI0029676C81|nr:5-azacytidine-induced protein 2 isoform X1 [Hemiscyllium ocellatum]
METTTMHSTPNAQKCNTFDRDEELSYKLVRFRRRGQLLPTLGLYKNMSMEGLTVEDDISILNHEEASPEIANLKYSRSAASSGDESLASHFALVTAYEDIKKRLKETESENSFLKKRARMLEERLLTASLDNEKNSLGEEEVNKAYQAYREVCIERDKMRQRLERMIKDQMDSVRILNETLQAKEVEILQLRSEVETHQVMDDLHRTQNSWDLAKSNNELKMYTLNQELEILKQECSFLRGELHNCKQKESSLNDRMSKREILNNEETVREVGLQKPYQDLKREMSNLHLVTKTQAELLRKLLATQGSTKNVQCLDDLVLDCGKLELNSSGAVYRAARSSSKDTDVKISNFPPSHHFQQETAALCDREFLAPWTNSRPSPVGSAGLEEIGSCGKSSFDDNSWVFPSSPMDNPSNAAFWKTGNSCPSSTMKIPLVNIRDSDSAFRS